MILLLIVMGFLLFITSFVQSFNISYEVSIDGSVGGQRMVTSDSMVTNYTNISYNENNFNDFKTNSIYNNSEVVHQSVLMIPLMLPHMRLLLELCLGISAVCLTIHLIVYGFVPKLRNTPGKCLMSLSLSLLTAAITFIVSLHIVPSTTGALCISVAIIRLYSFLGKPYAQEFCREIIFVTTIYDSMFIIG